LDIRLDVLGGVRVSSEEGMRAVEEVGLELVNACSNVWATISVVEEDKSAVTVVNELVEEDVEEVGVLGSCSASGSSASSCFVEDEEGRDSPPVFIFNGGGARIV
jgi:hypothetical protein